MKTNLLKIAQVIGLTVMALFLANCSSGSGSSTTSSSYVSVNGQCYNTSSGTYVSSSYCYTSGSCSGTYYYKNYYGNVVAINCTTSTSGYTYTSQLGNSYFMYLSSTNSVTYNCSGATLYTSAALSSTITCTNN